MYLLELRLIGACCGLPTDSDGSWRSALKTSVCTLHCGFSQSLFLRCARNNLSALDVWSDTYRIPTTSTMGPSNQTLATHVHMLFG